MATTSEHTGAERDPAPAPHESHGAVRDRRTGRDRPVGGFELWMWLFMRISGLILLILAVGHVLIMHLPDGGVERVDFGFVAARWGSPLWRTWDWMLLTLALVHGVNGLRNITLDYVRKPGLRLTITTFWYVIGFTMFVLGSVVVFTFDPTKWPPQ